MNAPPLNAPMVSGVDPLHADRAPQLPQPPLPLAPVGAQAVALDCAGGRVSADAGLVLRQDIEAQRGCTRHRAAGLADPRAPRRGKFPRHALRTQRGVPMAAGAEEANDATPLRDAPRCTRLRHRLPATGAPWAAHPTLSRGANRVARRARSRMARGVREPCLASSATPPTVLGLDVDAPEDRVHGQQDQARDEGSAGGEGGMPRPRDAGLSGRLRTTLLQAPRGTGAQRLAGLPRLVKRRRPAGPETLWRGRGDRHVAAPAVRPWSAAHPALRAGTGVTSHAG
jgi:hypothetical protein